MPGGCDIGSCSKACGGGECCLFSKKYFCAGRCNQHSCRWSSPPPSPPLPETTTPDFISNSTGSSKRTSAISSPFYSKGEPSEGISAGEVVAITAGCCMFLLVILLMSLLWRRRSRSKPTPSSGVGGATVVNELYEANPNIHYLTVIYNEQDKNNQTYANCQNFPGTSGTLQASETFASPSAMFNQYTDIDDDEVHSVDAPYEQVDIS